MEFMDFEGSQLDQATINEYRNQIHSLQAQLAQMNAIMEKIENGTYGECDICQKEITADVLKDQPDRTVCHNHDASNSKVLGLEQTH